MDSLYRLGLGVRTATEQLARLEGMLCGQRVVRGTHELEAVEAWLDEVAAAVAWWRPAAEAEARASVEPTVDELVAAALDAADLIDPPPAVPSSPALPSARKVVT